MMRWWNHEAYTKNSSSIDDPVKDQNNVPSDLLIENSLEFRKWTFRVRVDLQPGEKVCVSGSCNTLGNWKHDQVFILSKEKDDDTHIWSSTVMIPSNIDVEYRYVICIIVEPDGHRITQKHYVVRRWETNRKPRVIPKRVDDDSQRADEDINSKEVDIMGYYDNKERIDRGWLTTETAVQLKLYGDNLQVWKSKLKQREIFVKVTPIYLSRTNSFCQDNLLNADDGLSLETMDLSDKLDAWPVIEIGVMNAKERLFSLQEQFGRAFKPGDFIIFQILVHSPQAIALLMDFYAYSSKRTEHEPPCHIGFSYILPSGMNLSEGQVIVPITSTRHRPIGEVTVEYLVVKPTPNYKCDLSYSLHRMWKESWRGLDVGHRGVGSSFKGDVKQCAEVRENTIASLKSAASHGADFVEFDVQLSKDLVPVLYHDFYVAIALKRKKHHLATDEMIQLPVKDLPLEQLQRLKDIKGPHISKVLHFNESTDEPDDEALYNVGEKEGKQFSDEHLEEHQPFPTLQQALEVLDQSLGFNVEIKWTMRLKDGTYELYHPFDLNLYLDTVLEVVLQHAGKRNIIFSCFHPDICSMIRLKQNRFPVMFLTQGITDKYPPYHDPRCQTIPMAVHFACNMDILGINAHSEELLRDGSQIALVKRAGLVIFCWGDDNNDAATIKHLKELGIHAVIYDKIDQFGTKEVKESIFRLEARESERVVIKACAERASADEYLHPTPQSDHTENLILELEEARTNSVSSATSHWTKDNVGHCSSDFES